MEYVPGGDLMSKLIKDEKFSEDLARYIRFIVSTDLGSLFGNFDFGFSTVWKFSNFSAASIQHEINFG